MIYSITSLGPIPFTDIYLFLLYSQLILFIIIPKKNKQKNISLSHFSHGADNL